MSMTAAQARARLDATAKKLIKHRIILAEIMRQGMNAATLWRTVLSAKFIWMKYPLNGCLVKWYGKRYRIRQSGMQSRRCNKNAC